MTKPAAAPEATIQRYAGEATRWSLRAWIIWAVFVSIHVGALAVFFVTATWEALALCFVLYATRGFGITGGFHRYFAHRAYKTSRPFQFALGWLGASTVQGGPLWWSAHHRLHHKHSDQEGDPHSPITESVWRSHVGWILSQKYRAMEWDQVKDFKKFPELLWLERWDVVPPVVLAALCYAIGGVSGLVWGFFVSTVILYHVTFMVNSVCHLFGSRRFQTGDESRNNAFVALVTFGEGWHNNHHHYPSAARQGFRWYEVDWSYYTLKVLSWVGLVWDLRQPTPRALAARRLTKA